MNPIRVLMMMLTLFVLATTASAQELLPPPREIIEVGATAQPAASGCSLLSVKTWYVQALQETAASFQRLRILCASGKQASACCEAQSTKAAVGVVGCAKAADFSQAPKTCCCVKACACCESCKAKEKTTTRLPTWLSSELAKAIHEGATVIPMTGAKPCPVTGTWNPFSTVRVQVQAMPTAQAVSPRIGGRYDMPSYPQQAFAQAIDPVQRATPPMQAQYLPANQVRWQIGIAQCTPPVQSREWMPAVPVLPAANVVQVVHHVKPVHLVTPDLEAHCERMSHRGEMVVLEGNVLLLCRKHAQPLRIEAQRVVVNMRDGSFTVESDVHPIPAVNFGVMRIPGTSAVPQFIPVNLVIPSAAVPPATQPIIQVIPLQSGSGDADR